MAVQVFVNTDHHTKEEEISTVCKSYTKPDLKKIQTVQKKSGLLGLQSQKQPSHSLANTSWSVFLIGLTVQTFTALAFVALPECNKLGESGDLVRLVCG